MGRDSLLHVCPLLGLARELCAMNTAQTAPRTWRRAPCSENLSGPDGDVRDNQSILDQRPEQSKQALLLSILRNKGPGSQLWEIADLRPALSDLTNLSSAV